MQFKKFIKNTLEKILSFFKNINIYKFLLSLTPFLCLDLATKIFTKKLGFTEISYFPPWAFTFTWVLFFVVFALCFKKKISKIIYSIFASLSFILYLVHNIYFSMTEEIFDFHLMELASEGISYFLDAIKNANIWIYLIAIIIIGLFLLALKFYPKTEKNKPKMLIATIVIFIGLHSFCPTLLGKPNKDLSWNTWYNKRNIYMSFNDANKSFSITGMYEYSIRNFYLTFFTKEKTESETEEEFLNNIFNTEEQEYKNEYTGMFKGKNVIFLQLEGIDNWLVDEKTMPNLYSLMKQSINFTNHYSYYNGGGSTFNSEFAVNTGYITPITYTRNAYTFNRNTFTYSMARLFKNEGYTVNAFHMNSGEYYSRTINYKSWGFDHYYGLKDQRTYKNEEYQLDRELILNETFYNLMFKSEQPFVHYLITYSNHIPFSQNKGVCKLILNKQKEEQSLLEENDEQKTTTEEVVEEKTYTEEECIRIQAGETDYMVGLLIKALEDNDLIDNTIIVAYADHYLYTVSDKSILAQYKNTENNLINHTPFFIWSKDIKKKTITKVTSQINILPTALNLFGLEYHENYYPGKDALNKDYDGIVFFNDYSWYDGKTYSDGDSKDDSVNEKNEYVNYLIKKNDWVLKYDYFKQMLQKKEN